MILECNYSECREWGGDSEKSTRRRSQEIGREGHNVSSFTFEYFGDHYLRFKRESNQIASYRNSSKSNLTIFNVF